MCIWSVCVCIGEYDLMYIFMATDHSREQWLLTAVPDELSR